MNSVVLAVTAFTVGLGRGTAAFPSAQKSQEAFAVRQSLGHTFNSIGNRPGRHAGWYSDLPGSPASAKPSAAGRAGRLREECLQDPPSMGASQRAAEGPDSPQAGPAEAGGGHQPVLRRTESRWCPGGPARSPLLRQSGRKLTEERGARGSGSSWVVGGPSSPIPASRSVSTSGQPLLNGHSLFI